MLFIELHRKYSDCEVCMVNVNNISSFHPDGEGVKIYMVDGSKVYVRDSYEAIKKLMHEVKHG